MPKIHTVEPWDGKDGEVRGSITVVRRRRQSCSAVFQSQLGLSQPQHIRYHSNNIKTSSLQFIIDLKYTGCLQVLGSLKMSYSILNLACVVNK